MVEEAEAVVEAVLRSKEKTVALSSLPKTKKIKSSPEETSTSSKFRTTKTAPMPANDPQDQHYRSESREKSIKKRHSPSTQTPAPRRRLRTQQRHPALPDVSPQANAQARHHAKEKAKPRM